MGGGSIPPAPCTSGRLQPDNRHGLLSVYRIAYWRRSDRSSGLEKPERLARSRIDCDQGRQRPWRQTRCLRRCSARPRQKEPRTIGYFHITSPVVVSMASTKFRFAPPAASPPGKGTPPMYCRPSSKTAGALRYPWLWSRATTYSQERSGSKEGSASWILPPLSIPVIPRCLEATLVKIDRRSASGPLHRLRNFPHSVCFADGLNGHPVMA